MSEHYWLNAFLTCWGGVLGLYMGIFNPPFLSKKFWIAFPIWITVNTIGTLLLR